MFFCDCLVPPPSNHFNLAPFALQEAPDKRRRAGDPVDHHCDPDAQKAYFEMPHKQIAEADAEGPHRNHRHDHRKPRVARAPERAGQGKRARPDEEGADPIELYDLHRHFAGRGRKVVKAHQLPREKEQYGAGEEHHHMRGEHELFDV